jgi:conjugative relaxase-like TrwC/TraI family protein
MVSIGKLANGHADYYLHEARGRVDRATSVSSGVEDYYLEGSERDGLWIGTGGAALDATGSVTPDGLRRVLEGQHPVSGRVLGRHAAVRIPGFDVTFSAPKSVSVLFGVGDHELRDTIRRAHEAATVCLDTYAHVMAEQAGAPTVMHTCRSGERVSAEQQIVLARDAVASAGFDV